MKVVLTGGGTAGHVFPAIAVGAYLKEHHQADLHYIGNEHHVEANIAGQQGIPFYSIPSRGLEGKNPVDKYGGFAIHNLRGVAKAIRILKTIRPDFVFGTGGFVSAPVLAAAKVLKIPFSIHEQNSVLGKVNRLFKNHAQNTFFSFPIPEDVAGVYCGNPVRFKEPLLHNGEDVVFVGGSGGSMRLNEAALDFAEKNPTIPCILLTGKNLFDVCKEKSEKVGVVNLEVLAYAEDMLSIYQKAKVIVCRSGAGTIFEIANLSIPAVFVPLPNSADDHQKKNAQYFEKQKAAVMVEQGLAFDHDLASAVLDLWNNEEKRKELKGNIDKLAARHSDRIIVEYLTEAPFQRKSDLVN